MTTREQFNIMQQAVFARRPVLAEIIRRHGQKPLSQYTQDYINVNLNPPIQRRQDELIAVLQECVARIFGQTIAGSVAQQLRRYYFVSTADHHGPLCHPFFVNTNITSALPFMASPQPGLENLLVLSCSTISFSNSSFPRGLFFHSFERQQLYTHRLVFVPSAAQHRSVYRYPAYTADAIYHSQKRIDTLELHRSITTDQAQQLRRLLQDVYADPAVLALPDYVRQVSVTNRLLWERLFVQSGVALPRLLYLAIEDVVIELLLRHHVFMDTVIQHLLFDPSYTPLIHQFFDGIMGAFTQTGHSGTYFFWALPPQQKYRQQLWLEGNTLITPDRHYQLPFTPAAVAAALQRREIIPNMLLCYMVLSFYYGLKCLGGFNQVNYLTQMKNAYIKLNVDKGNYRSIEVCARAQTKELNDGLTLAFASLPDGKRILASSLDIMLYGSDKSWQNIVTAANNFTLAEAIAPLLPELYRVVYGETERNPAVLTLTDDQIITALHLEKKIQPCVEIPLQLL